MIFNMRFYSCIFFLFLFLVNVKAADFTLNQGGTAAKNYYITIPVQNVSGRIIMDVKLQGKIRKFLLDTGAPVMLTKELFNELKLPVLKNSQITDSQGVRDSMKVVSLSGIEIGGLVFDSIPAVIIEDFFLFECMGLDGIIGSNFFRNTTLQLNLKESNIVLTDYSADQTLLCLKQNSRQMLVDSFQSRPFITVQLMDKSKMLNINELNVLFDTGDDGLYSQGMEVFEQVKDYGLMNILNNSEGAHSMGLNELTKQEHYRVQLPELQINGMTFKNHIFNTRHGSSHVGTRILDYGIVTLDFPNQLFCFEPFEVDVYEKTWNISPVFKDGKFVVGTIWDKSLEDKINVGDQILQIDNINYRGLTICEIFDQRDTLTKDKDKNTAKAILKDINTGKEKTVEISRF